MSKCQLLDDYVKGSTIHNQVMMQLLISGIDQEGMVLKNLIGSVPG